MQLVHLFSILFYFVPSENHCRNNLRNMFQFQCLARNYLVFFSMIHWQWTEIKRCISLIGNFIWMHSTKVDYWNKMHCIAKTNALPSKCGILKIALSKWSFLMRIKRVFDWHSIIELHWKCFKQKKNTKPYSTLHMLCLSVFRITVWDYHYSNQ